MPPAESGAGGPDVAAVLSPFVSASLAVASQPDAVFHFQRRAEQERPQKGVENLPRLHVMSIQANFNGTRDEKGRNSDKADGLGPGYTLFIYLP